MELTPRRAEHAETRGGVKWLNSTSDPVTDAIIGAALEVHRRLGPGLLESAYCECLALELSARGVPFKREVPLDVVYRGVAIGTQYRLDFVVVGAVVVEVKSLERTDPVHRAQLITYLKLGRFSRGLLVNFGAPRLARGIHRIVNGWIEDRSGSSQTAPRRAESAESRGDETAGL